MWFLDTIFKKRKELLEEMVNSKHGSETYKIDLEHLVVSDDNKPTSKVMSKGLGGQLE